MAKGIVRAAERVAIWHQADSSIAEEPPTSTPPAGVEGPKIPNSNKFKIPANGLKKTLETTTHPSQGFHPPSTQAVETWLNNKPDFTKTYFKPQYNEALKAHLGEENHAKLMHHAPTPYTDALTIHQQAPAPKSNKFTTPANTLKKLLEDPHTETSHVQQWMEKNPGFAKTYLKPNYADALKGHLGEQNYAELQTHLNPQEKAQEKGAPNAAQTHGDALQKVHQHLTDHGVEDTPELHNYLNGLDTATVHNLAEGVVDPFEHFQDFGQPQQASGLTHELLHKHFPHLEESPGTSDEWVKGYADDDPDELAPYSHQQFLDNISHTGIGKEFQDVTTSPGFKDWWDNQDPQWQHNYIQDPAQAIDDYDEWDNSLHDEVEPADLGYGDEAYSHDEPGDDDEPQHQGDSQYYQKLLNAVAPGSSAGHVMHGPAFKKWLHEAYPDLDAQGGPYQNGVKKSPLALLNQFKDFQKSQPQDEPQSDEEQIKAIEDLQQPVQQQPDLNKIFSEAANPALINGIQKIFPQHGLDPYASQDEVKSQLESWLKYLPDHEGFSEHVPQLQALYDQHFGKQQPVNPSGGPDLSMELDGPLSFLKDKFEGKPFPDQMALLKSMIENPGQLGSFNKPYAQELYDKYVGGLPQTTKSELGFGDKLKALGISPSAEAMKAWNKADPHHMQNVVLPNLLNNFPDKADQIKKLYAEQFGDAQATSDQPKPGTGHPFFDAYDKAVEESAAPKKLDVDGQQPSASVPTSDQLKSALEADVFSEGDHPAVKAWLKKSPEKAKADILSLSQGTSPSGFHIDDPKLVAKWKKVYDTLYGGGDQPSGFSSGIADTPQSTFGSEVPMGFLNDGYNAQSPFEWAPGAQAWLAQHHGITSPQDVQYTKLQPAHDQWLGMSQEEKQPYIDMEQGGALSGQQSPSAPSFIPQTSGPAPFDGLAIAKAMQQADPHTFDDKWVDEVKNNSPEEFKNHLEGLLGGNWDPEEKAQYQTLLDKYFGEDTQQPAQHEPYDPAQLASDFAQAYGGVKNNVFKSLSAEDAKKKLKTLADPDQGYSEKMQQAAQDMLDKYFGQGDASSPQQSSIFDKTKTPTANEMMALGISSQTAHSLSKQSPEQFWKNYDIVKAELATNNGWVPPLSWQEVMDKLAPSGEQGQQSIQQSFDWDTFGPEFKAVFPASSWGSNPHSEAEAKEKLQNSVVSANENYPGTEKTKAINELYEKWFGGGQSAGLDKNVTPSADWFESLGINSSLASQFAQKSPSEFWNNVVTAQQLAAKDPDLYSHDSPWAKILKAVGGAEQQAPQGGLDAFLNQVGLQQPEPESEEPAKPFKSEPVDPEDFTHWQDHKPQTPAEWKSFATWWGNTQLSPEEESNLYHAWFPSGQADPGSWFQQVFEHNSSPSNADLGTEDSIPGWAHNSWAFGDKADQEWPLFKAWATQHPGIPKGTSLKQKLAIWKGLSDEDKAQIAGDYAPENPVDTKAVVHALKAAYPDSDWSKWAKMPQGTLQKSLESLGKAGYGPAASVYNQFFGGDLPVPQEPEEDAESQDKAEQPLPPPETLPGWVQKQVEGKPPGQVKKLTKDFMSLAKFADSVGQGHLLDANEKTPELAKLGKSWQLLPGNLKAQIDQMDALPWQDMAGFEQWRDAQPTIADALKEVLPGFSGQNYPWQGSGFESAKQQALGQYINKADPETRQKLLGIYSEFFGHDKTTLAESLKQIDPDQDWDKLLQSKSKAQVASLIKKQLKTEKDPAKWAQLASVWLKHFPHPDIYHKPAPTGIKALTDFFKYQSPGGKLDASDLAKLHAYKTLHPDNDLDYIPYHYGKEPEHQEVGQQLAALDDGKSFLPYLGWTPPSGGAMGSFKMDPAMYGKSEQSATYTVPEETNTSNYKNLLTKADSLKQLFSDKDRDILKSDSFRNWFEKAPAAYRSSIEANPGIALDDYESFMSGGQMYSDVPQGKKNKHYDLSPFALTPTPKNKDIPKSHQQNPKRWDEVKFPQYQDAQETLPLPGGEKWAPKYAPMPIYRVMNIELDKADHQAPTNIRSQKARELFNQQQIARLRRIDEIINGAPTARNPQQDFKYLKNWGAKHGLDDKAIQDMASVMFSQQPDLFTDEKWKHLEDFARKQGINPAEMHELANQLEVTPPPSTKGNYDHPELAQLLLDYMEANSHRDSEGGSGSQGGLGWHWTRDKDKAYNGVPAAGAGAMTDSPSSRRIPVAVSALWGGQGEGAGHGGAYDPNDKRELEHNLRTHAPVHVRRLQIRSPDMDWHDLMDYGPMSLWSPGRNETASGKEVLDKPSLAKELTNVLGASQPKDLDTLKPGHQADAVFSQLVQKYPSKKDQILKLYRDFFVGRPELPTKPHVRRASIQAIPHVATLDEQNPAHLYDLATSWGVARPERYGLPFLKELASDLKGVGWAWKEMTKEHALGIPNPRRGQPTVAALEAQIARLAYSGHSDDLPGHIQKPHWLSGYQSYGHVPGEYQDHYHNFLNGLSDPEVEQYSDPNLYGNQGKGEDYRDDFEQAWEDYLEANGVKPNWEYDNDDEDDFNDDYEYDDDDFDGGPPLPTTDRPKGWLQQAPWLKNDPRGRQYFPPHGLNGPSMSGARPDIDWEEDVPEHPMLPIPRDFLPAQHPRPGEQHQLFDVADSSHEWPNDTRAVPMYRGLMLNLSPNMPGDPLGHVRRALWGGDYEPSHNPTDPTGAFGPGPFNNQNLAKPHLLGFDNPNLGEHILNHVQNNPQAYEGHSGYGLGPHWTADLPTAQSFAKGTTLGGNGEPMKLPTVIRAQWKGLGEDPYRTNTQGDWPEEHEVTMLPGAKMHIDSVKIQHPHTQQWHEVLPQPTQRHAQVEVRKPRGILSHAEMRR